MAQDNLKLLYVRLSWREPNFILQLKETAFRYNTQIQNENLHKKLLFLIRENPLKLD